MHSKFIVFTIAIIIANDYGILAQSIDSFDWRDKGVVTPVEDYSGSPHVAGVVMVETIESLHAIATGKLQRGSVARVIDCCAKEILSYECIRKMGGICTYDGYPTVRGTCEKNACQPFATFDSVDGYRETNDSSLISLIQKATFAVGFDASERSFADYTGGIYREKNCSQTLDTTALQIVGYGSTDEGEQYWIARNSWGEEWGEKGYIRILRGENICGIGSQVYQPKLTASSSVDKFYYQSKQFLVFIVMFYMMLHKVY